MPTDDEVRFWLEMAEARAYADVTRATAAMAGDPLGAGLVTTDSFVAFWLTAIDFGFFNRCIGLGVATPAIEKAVDMAIDTFRAAGREQFGIQVSPFAQPAELETWLVDRGFRPSRRWAKVWRGTEDPPAERTDPRIERIGPERRDDWERVVMTAFQMPPVVTPVSSATLGRDGWQHYLSFAGELAVGAAAMQAQDGVAWLGYAATPSHIGAVARRAPSLPAGSGMPRGLGRDWPSRRQGRTRHPSQIRRSTTCFGQASSSRTSGETGWRARCPGPAPDPQPTGRGTSSAHQPAPLSLRSSAWPVPRGCGSIRRSIRTSGTIQMTATAT